MAKKAKRNSHYDTRVYKWVGAMPHSQSFPEFTVSEADTSHSPEPFLYKCEPCNEVFLFKMISLLRHFRSVHSDFPLPYCKSCKQLFDTSTDIQNHNKSKHQSIQAIDSETPANSVMVQMDGRDLNSRRDDDDDQDTNVNGRGGSKDVRDCDAKRDPSLEENHPSPLLRGNISKSLSSVSDLTPCQPESPSLGAPAGPSSSKLDKATALARAALRNRFDELRVLKSSETTPLFASNIWGPRKADSSASNLDASGSSCVATNLTLNSSNSDEKIVKESKLPLNLLDNITHSFTCPGCRMDFKPFSGFVLHIENRSCMSSMCHEIEDQLNAFVTQFFNTLASSGTGRA